MNLSQGDKHIIYYPRETYEHVQDRLPDTAARRHFLRRQIRLEIELLRQLSRHYSMEAIERVFPPYYETLFRELLFGAYLERSRASKSSSSDRPPGLDGAD